MKRIILAALLPLATGAVSITGLFFPPVHAQESDMAALVQQRHQDMKTSGAAMKTLSGIFRAAPPYDRALVAQSAETIATRTGSEAATLFPDASLEVAGSGARAKIAQDRQRFEQLFINLQTESETLAALARQEGNDRELRAAFAQLGQVCSACHTDFRAKH